jgi:hypothetical protein
LASSALEQTDYSQYAPLNKKVVDVDNYPAPKVEDKKSAAPSEPRAVYSQKSQKQGQLTSALDDHGYTPNQSSKKWAPQDSYAEKKTVAIPAKNPNAAKKQ